jgi:hypothetical protein
MRNVPMNVEGRHFTVNLQGYRPDFQMWPTRESTKSAIVENINGIKANVHVRPYFHLTRNGAVAEWFFGERFQIICAGLDGSFGAISEDIGSHSQGPPAPHVPLDDNLQGDGFLDNILNFGMFSDIH